MRDKLSLPKGKSEDSITKISKPIKVLNSLKEILVDIFTTEIDKKTLKAKPLKLTTTHETAIKNIKLNDRLSELELKNIIKLVRNNDKELKIVLQLAISSQQCNHSEIKRLLINICVSIVSSLEFLNPLNAESNIFQGMLSEYKNNRDAVGILNAQLKKKFEFRAEGIKKSNQINKAKEALNISKDIDVVADKSKGMTLVQLDSMRKNVQALSCLWCYEFEKSKPDLILDWFYKILAENTKSKDKKQERSIPYFLAKQLLSSNRDSIVESIAYFKEKESSAKKQCMIEQQTVSQITDHNNKLILEVSSLKSCVEEKETQLKVLTAEVESLKKQFTTDVMQVKAERVHLKDDTGKVKSKAINLLEEDVLPTLKTSLKGLKKDEPKVSFAVDKLDLVIEDIEGALQWFKK
ncbi:hypothetical protein [Colwellia sp. Arc7-D]|uniref:hypothetical protein n=1 Tax=Colwellia sp. Arc7-D TaxID=2161872 RepID=UPI000D381953|nr:hypothetical protein [Colwellia sp. Arc7-D]AWB57833.1 hypothetical protein DBO93_09795 [Colwellia sp. Arc7-D]